MRLSVLAAAACLAACQRSALDTVKDMRARACSGDVAGFFSYVDRKEFADTMVRDAHDQVEAKIRTLAPLLRASFRRGAEAGMADLPRIAAEGMADWEQDIKRGAAGDLCRTSVIGSTEVEYSADVRAKTPTGHDKVWRLSRTGKRWFLIGMRDAPPTGTSPPAP